MKYLIASAFVSIFLTACLHSGYPVSNVMSEPSDNTFSTTETRLRAALEKRNLKLFTVIDHGEGAKSVSENIGQSKLFIFGNPKAGTPLMIAEPKLVKLSERS